MPAIVAKYAADMRRGSWILSPQGIAFDEKGRVIDGQHRLLAIIQSGCSIPMYVVSECGNEAIKALDQGAVRTVANMMQILGIRSSYSAAAVGGIARAMISGVRGWLVRIPRSAVLQCVEDYAEDIDYVLETTGARQLRRVAAYAPLVKAANVYGHSKLEDFCASIHDNVFDHNYAPANLLSRYVNRATRIRVCHIEVYGKAVTAVRAYLEDRPIKSLGVARVDICLGNLYERYVPEATNEEHENLQHVEAPEPRTKGDRVRATRQRRRRIA